MNFTNYEIELEQIRRSAHGHCAKGVFEMLLNEIEVLSEVWSNTKCNLKLEKKSRLNELKHELIEEIRKLAQCH